MSDLENKDLMTDEQLFAQWQNGDGESFEILLERYQGRLFRVILAWVKDFEQAEDLFQETWMRVISHREKFDSQRKFSSWLFQIALNLARDQWRREKREQKRAEGVVLEKISSPHNPEREYEKRERKEKLLWALSQLSELEREVFMLRHFGGLRFSEIADLLGINLNTALSRMHQAVGHLQRILGGKE